MADITLREIKYAKITDWANEPQLTDLKRDLESSRQYQQQHISKIQEWNDLRDIQGKAKPPKIKGHSSIQPKLVRRQAEWRYPALSEPFLSSDKLFTVSPVTFEDVDAARQNELVINYQFRTQIDTVKFIDDFIHSVVDDGTCFIRLGWERETKTVQKEEPVFDHYPIQDEERLQVFQQMLELSESDPRTYDQQVDEATKACVDLFKSTGVPTMARQVGTQMVEEEEIVINRPTLKVVDPDCLFVDPTSRGDFSKALFVVETFPTNLAELKKSGLYKNLDQVNWDAVTSDWESTKDADQHDFRFQDKTRKKVYAYEYWGYYDIHNDGRLSPIVATWIGDVLIRMEENPFPDNKIPYVCVVYSPVKRELYGEPDAELLKENQQILGAVTRGSVDLLGRSANAQQGIAKNMLDPLNKRRFENGQDYEFNPNVNPSANNYILHKFPEIPQSAIVMMNLMNEDSEALSGVKSFSGGLSGNAYGDVATGIKGILDAASRREMAILRRLAKGMVSIGRKIIAMNAVFLRDTEIVRVTNDSHVAIDREDLTGDFDLLVDISTTSVDDNKAQDLGFLLQTMGPNMSPMIYMMILSEIARLKRMPDLAEQFKNWKPEPDPIAEQMRQLEMLKLQKQIQEIDANIKYLSNRADKNQADAQNTSADTVLKLSGTKHRQDVEKQQAQARGNQNLEITKALLTQQDPTKTLPNIDAAVGYNSLTQ